MLFRAFVLQEARGNDSSNRTKRPVRFRPHSVSPNSDLILRIIYFPFRFNEITQIKGEMAIDARQWEVFGRELQFSACVCSNIIRYRSLHFYLSPELVNKKVARWTQFAPYHLDCVCRFNIKKVQCRQAVRNTKDFLHTCDLSIFDPFILNFSHFLGVSTSPIKIFSSRITLFI